MISQETYFQFLSKLGSVFYEYHRATNSKAIIVGGAATAIFTHGEFMSADVDVLVGRDEEFSGIMAKHGFERNTSGMHRALSFYHAEFAQVYVEVVSGPLFDGYADHGRIVRLTTGDNAELLLPSIEDMIADRLGQYAAGNPEDTSRLEQARFLVGISQKLDKEYLERRISDEGGDISLIDLP